MTPTEKGRKDNMKNETEAAWVKEFSKFIAKVEYRPTPDEIKSFIRTLLSSTEKATMEKAYKDGYRDAEQKNPLRNVGEL
mgnify:CR=1 FL=1